MHVLEAKETIHIYYEREEEKRPYTLLPLFFAWLCLLSIAAVTIYSWEFPTYEHERLTVPATFLPLKVFRAEAPIIPTGVKTYPATFAHGYLTFSNGSVISLSIPQGFTIDGAATDRAIYVPPATANGFGIATVPAHLLTLGINMSTLAINALIGSSLFIRNLSPFTGGHPAYSVTIQLSKDRQAAIDAARSLIAAQEAHIQVSLAEPCKESTLISQTLVRLAWSCQFATYKVPSHMRVLAVHLSGKSFLVDVVFVPRPERVWVK